MSLWTERGISLQNSRKAVSAFPLDELFFGDDFLAAKSNTKHETKQIHTQ